jgi:mono/diheme cytochrome c family protein
MERVLRTLRNCFALAALVCLGAVTGCARLPRPPEGRTPLERRGRHVLRIAEGCSCHGANFAGWRAGGPDRLPGTLPYGERFVGAFGKIPAPNITPDPEAGIGRWSDAEIARALREGIRPDGSRLHPLMPYLEYRGMAESDVAALVAYLHRLRPIRNRVPPKELTTVIPEPGPSPPAPAAPPERGVALGRYLVESVSGCRNCHSPAGATGPEPGMLLAGKALPVAPGETVLIPNITPDPETGIGRWRAAEIATYLRTGRRPDGRLAQSLMAALIIVSFSHFTREEADAIAAYLKSLPPVQHRPGTKLPTSATRARGCHA